MASGARLTLIRATDGSTREMLVRDFFKERLYRQVGFARMFYTPVYRELLHARCVCEASHANFHASLHGVFAIGFMWRLYTPVYTKLLHEGRVEAGAASAGLCDLQILLSPFSSADGNLLVRATVGRYVWGGRLMLRSLAWSIFVVPSHTL